MNFFEYEVRQRKQLACMASHRKRGSKSKKCTLSTDNMTRRQWEKECGPVMVYKMGVPKSWAEFKSMPVDFQREYLSGLVGHFGVNLTALSEMFGVSPISISKHVHSKGLGLHFQAGKKMSPRQRELWTRFLSMEHANDSVKSEEPDSEDDSCAVPVEDDAHDGSREESEVVEHGPSMTMKQFSIVLEGKIDASMLANSIMSVLGPDAVGRVEISVIL